MKMSTEGFSYEEEIVDPDEVEEEEDTDIYGEPEGLSNGYGTPMEGSSYREDTDDEQPDYSGVKGTALKYQDTLGSAVGGAAGGAIMFGQPELALLAGGATATGTVMGKAAAKGASKIKDYLNGEGEAEEASDEQYATA